MPQPIPDELKDTPYGIASVDFPVTFYDRPELAFASLLRGDVDGMTRSMLSPDSLSPSQMQDVAGLLTKGKKTSPVMKTILEISTNPLVILGLIASLRYPIGSTKTLLALREGLLPKAAAMGKMTSGLHGALMNLRTVPKAFDTLWGLGRETERFITRHGSKASDLFKNAQAVKPLSKAEGALVAARLDGLHDAEHYMVKALRDTPEYASFMGGRNVPIAPGLQANMDKRLLSLSDKLKGWYKGVWGDLYSNPATRANMETAAAKKGIQLGEEVSHYFPHQGQYNKYYQASLRGATGVEYRKYLSAEYGKRLGKQNIQRLGGMFIDRDSLLLLEESGAVKKGFVQSVVDPTLRRWSDDASSTASKIWGGVSKSGLNAAEQRVEFVSQMTEHYTKGAGKKLNFVGRMGDTKRARDTLDAMAGALQDAQLQGGDALRREFGEIGATLGAPASYGLDVWKTTERYVNSVAADYAYHATGLGKQMQGVLQTPGIFKNAPHLESYVVDGLLPHVMGYNTYPQMQRILSDATRKMKLVDWVGKHPMVRETLGGNHTDALLDWVKKPGSLSGQSLGGQVANWFHLSTLGMNLSATSANSMQTFLTTINNVGPGGIWRGLNGFGNEAGLLSRANKYMGMVAGRTKTNKAFNSAFPEFVEEMGEWSKTTERLLSGDIAKSGYEQLFKAKGVWDKVKGGMMAPFSTTEAGNQLLSFYSGRNQHLFKNATRMAEAGMGREASKVGGSLALLTQFAGGPLGIPKSIMNMNPMWRQYMHFPMRYLGYLHGSLRMGTDPSKMDWGVIGRSLAGSTAAYIAARNLAGVDLSRGLMVGAMPIPQSERAVFSPWPMVPPAVSVIGEAAKSLLTGDARGLGYTAAMAVPGGVAMRRAYKSLSPRYADYKAPNPDGTIPLYNADQSLVGSLTPMQLSLRAIGLKSSGVSAEAAAAKWMLSQRDRIREYRRKYTQAIFDNEPVEAEKINAAFQGAYPELGPINLKKSDIRSIRDRRQMSRIQRISKGMSRSYRPIFDQVLADASLGQITQGINIPGIEEMYGQLPEAAASQTEYPLPR